MVTKKISKLSRREFMRLSVLTAAGISISSSFAYGSENIPMPMKRRLGKTNFYVTTFGLGGQSSLQWTPKDVDPVKIILKAFKLGLNLFDTSNLYGDSQLVYGKAFRELMLIPGEPGYNKLLRESIFLNSKTFIRWAKGGGYPTHSFGESFVPTNGDHGEGCVADLKRSLSQIFGDNKGNYPEGAYLDMIMIHSVMNRDELDVLYKGLETPLDPNGNFGALIALRDFRDGTNITGMNPKKEKLIRHIGFSGHYSSPVMMEMIRRDKWDLIDCMLVSLNVNDRRYLNMQYNVMEVARVKDIGIIGMKVFSDGAMYTKEANWSWHPDHVVRTVGSEIIPSSKLIEYVLTAQGVNSLIIGIGHIDENLLKCQMVQNFYASQIEPDELTEEERREIEKLGLKAKNGRTNWFQLDDIGLTPPTNIRISPKDQIIISWDTAIAGGEPISHYEILKDGVKVEEVGHNPQITAEPFLFYEKHIAGKEYSIVTVDKTGRRAASEPIKV